MFWLNIKIAIRSLYKNRIYSILNLLGLAIGFTAFILISLYTDYEYSWDKHNANYNRSYRIQRHFVKTIHSTDGNNISPHSRGLTAKLLSSNYPEFESLAIIKEMEGLYLSSQTDKLLFDKEGIASEQSIFDVFTYHFVEGNKSTSLVESSTVVLSQTLAKKLFPDGNSVGKMIVIEKKYNLKVTGVYEDLPYNSIVRPSFILSLATLEKHDEYPQTTLWGGYMIYALLRPGEDYKALNVKIGNLFKGYRDIEDEKIQLCPMSKLHLNYNDRPDYLAILFFYRLIGIFILVLSAFNYINLTTANTSVRAKEIGIRKVHGSYKHHLILQFLGETILLSLIAINIAFLFSEMLLPWFNALTNTHLVFSYSSHTWFLFKILTIALITGIVSGLYPAFFMSGQKITNLFKNTIFRPAKKHFGMKKVLVALQFSIAIILIITTLAFTLQINYLTKKNLGFTKENMLYATISITRKNSDYSELRNRILQHREITDMTFARHLPFVSFGGKIINWEGAFSDETLNIRLNEVCYDFVKAFDIKIVKGRDFSRNFPSDVDKACLINETAMRNFGYKDPIGKRIDNNRLSIIGVVKDYHFKDMHNQIEPLVLILSPDSIRPSKWTFGFKVIPSKIQQSKTIITNELETYYPNDPFEVCVLADAFDNEYAFKLYHSIDKTFISFTILNILLAIMGLLGLVSFSVQRRTKEIGVRKIIGCSTANIFTLLTNEYLALLLIASVIAWPFAYLMISKLPGTYKIPMPYWAFLAATVLVAVISLATTAYFTLKAALRNPVEALRYE